MSVVSVGVSVGVLVGVSVGRSWGIWSSDLGLQEAELTCCGLRSWVLCY